MDTKHEILRVYRVLRGKNGASGHARMQADGGRAGMSLYARGLKADQPVRALVVSEQGVWELCRARADGRGAMRCEADCRDSWGRAPDASLFLVDMQGATLLEGEPSKGGCAVLERDRARLMDYLTEKQRAAKPRMEKPRAEKPVPPKLPQNGGMADEPERPAPAPEVQTLPPAPEATGYADAQIPLCEPVPPPFPLTPIPLPPLPKGIHIPALERPCGRALDCAWAREAAQDAQGCEREAAEPLPRRACDALPKLCWPECLSGIKPYFDHAPAFEPIDAIGWRFVRVTLPSGQGSFSIGIRTRCGHVVGVGYLVPGDENVPPPPALHGYQWRRGHGGQGYWCLWQRVGDGDAGNVGALPQTPRGA